MSKHMLFDTNIVADFFNNIPEAVDLFVNLEKKHGAISVVTYTEVLVGFDNIKDIHVLDRIMESLLYFSIEKSTARIAADLRKQYRWKLPDAYQAAIAIEHNLELVTRNTKDFDPKIHKFVKIPYRIK